MADKRVAHNPPPSTPYILPWETNPRSIFEEPRPPKGLDMPLPPNIAFLNPPQGQTSLRAPRPDEAGDILGNVAGNDPYMIGKLAQVLLKLREPLGTASMATMGAGTPIVPKPLAREAAYFTGMNPRQQPGQPLLPNELDATRTRVGKEVLMNALNEMAALPRRTDIADAIAFARQRNPGGIPLPPPTGQANVTSPLTPPARKGKLPKAGLELSPENVNMTQEEIKAAIDSLDRSGRRFNFSTMREKKPKP